MNVTVQHIYPLDEEALHYLESNRRGCSCFPRLKTEHDEVTGSVVLVQIVHNPRIAGQPN